ncbi:type II toxin-antitoxin system VapC family toxin [Microlunatus elymi]|uniref:Ribonuclease VapC n=1 Tax=Microlunatus elymi TaxID=2596828 RepID=A0A516PXN9_9ACTN|nr:type II toxin-antitoxin system VapC family toxin [Microlunatus elymi]QDP95937.1 type II toxin-antitoxin system VapC family toxin [Microlunatus elymi]
MARVIALDAGVLIALFDANDAHHAAAEELFADNADEPMTIGPINQAEVLVRAARENRDEQMLSDLRSLDISTTQLPDDAAPRLARLRARTGAKMPDCCVLLTAEQVSGRVATFDDRLRQVALSLGLRVVDLPSGRPAE